MPDQARPQLSLSRKRKERDAADAPAAPNEAEPHVAAGNRLLAGYLAHEFLTRGTLLGQRLEPAVDPNAIEHASNVSAYADVAALLKTDGAHVLGVLNPTHLSGWLQMPLFAPPQRE